MFFERIIDVLCLERDHGGRIEEFDFLSFVDCGPRLPVELGELIERSLRAACGVTEPREDVFEKTENAYLDTINIYRLTNPLNAENREQARERDSRSSDDPFLALFHPISLPGHIDFANESHREWQNPSGEGEIRNESLWELFESAKRSAAPAIRSIAETISGRGKKGEIAALIGNGNLSDGGEGKPRRPKITDPLPLPEMLSALIHPGTLSDRIVLPTL